MLSAAPLAGISDGSFPAPALAPATYQVAPASCPWRFSGFAGISSNASPLTTNVANSPMGTQVGFIKNGGCISQQVYLDAGVYNLSFQAAQQANNQTQNQTLEILVDGAVVGAATPVSYNYIGAVNYQYTPYQSNNFSVTAGLHTVQFLGLSPSTANSIAFIGQVAVTPIVDFLLDGGLENPVLAANSFAGTPGGSPWLFSGAAGVSRNGSAFQTNWTEAQNAPQGLQAAYLEYNGSLTQTVYLDAGNFQISMAAAQRAIYQSHYQSIQVLFDGSAVATIIPTSTLFSAYQTPVFTATAGVHTVKFVGLDPLGGDNTAFLDAITLAKSGSVNDGSFEYPVLAANSYLAAPTGTPWVFSGGSGIAANGSAITAGNPAAPDGVQAGYITNGGSMSQSVYLYAGVYNFSVLAARRGNNSNQPQTIRVLVDGTAFGTITPAGTNYGVYQSLNFSVSTGAHTITLQGTTSSTANATLLLDLATTVAVTDTISDGSFETPALAANSYQTAPSGAPWQFSGSAGLSANGAGYTSGNPNAPNGGQVAFLTNTGSMSQTIYLDPGAYNISFLAAQRANSQTAPQRIQVLVDGSQVGLATPQSTTYGLYQTTNFFVGAGAHSIQFLGLNQQGGSVTALVDLVSIAAAEDGTTNNSAKMLQSNAVSDGGFETPALPVRTFQAAPNGSPWLFNGSAGISANNSAFTTSNPTSAPAGVQVAYIQNNASIAQAVYLDAGLYNVTFYAAQRSKPQTQPQQIAVLIDGVQYSVITPVQSFVPSNNSYNPATYYALYQSASFAVGAGMHMLTLKGLASPSGDSTAFIDSVAVNNANGILNGGFETPPLAAKTFAYAPAGASWQFGGSAGISTNASGFSWGLANAPDGNQAAFIQNTGSMSQTFYLTSGLYSLSFMATQRRIYQSNYQQIQVLIDGVAVATVTPANMTSSTSGVPTWGLYQTPLLSLTTGFHTVKFVGLNPAGGDNTALIDSVSF